ncbi:nucleotidyltransferase family protein [Salegentibacter sp. JZCK2]|uniref:nucleotidyltransferase family protein n=1 Tax=Salegentibacter tibetensis TaxID=2873600 RepID=UPI001CCE5D1D|nr:nucleotidyltransferase family protein [Salegentibacter tibetensis]MBZ9729227.1 nucleotidyltransferase family protein [Salegentibacter tibetensis]
MNGLSRISMQNLEEIKVKLRAHKNALSKKYHISKLSVFGSYARGEQQENSDLDILVDFKENIGIKIIDLAEELEQIIGLKVDLISRNALKTCYFMAIEKELVNV